MTIEMQIQVGHVVTIRNKYNWRHGRTYVVKGFNADKFGKQYAICELVGEIGLKSPHYLYAEDFA